jgi:hypothetical protein
MTRLGKDAWAKPSLKTEEVEIDELGGTVLIRELPAEYSAEVASHIEMRTIGREQVAKVDTTTMERLQFVYGVIDDEGNPLFQENEVRTIAKQHGRAFKTVIAAIDSLSGIDKEAIDKAERRFQSGGTGPNGAGVGTPTPKGSGRPDVPPRAGS